MTRLRKLLSALTALMFVTPAAMAARDDLRFLDVYVEAESDSPRVCFQFNRPLAEGTAVRYRDYVRFEPQVAADYSVQGSRLCASGVEHGRLYVATLLIGLLDRSGKTLQATQRFNVAIADREPTLGFPGKSYILPGRGKRELPLDAVNVDLAAVKVLRINDRNLINEINQGRISTLLAQWDAERVASVNGELVWEGEIEIESVKNRTVSTAVPIGEILTDPEPGIYIVMAIPKAERRGYVYQEATQWVVMTDIGISSFSGADGMHVVLRSLDDATPLGGLDVRLLARNNEVLGRATSDAAGMVRFDPGLLRGKGGAAPGAVMAFGTSGVFSFLDLTKPAFDLTDRGVGGREAAGPIDAFLYTDRGVYRPGETVNLVAMMRDGNARALDALPLSLRIRRPDGTVHDTVTFTDGASGGAHHLVLPLSGSARTGRWSVEALVDPEAPPVGRATFQVEDFVPERMEVVLAAAAAVLRPGEANRVDLTARFLYGAPAADLAVEGEIVLQEDMNPYPDQRGYKFGLIQEEWRPRREDLPTMRTDAEGRAAVPVTLDVAPDTSRPLRALVRLSVVESGGRAVSRAVSLPLRAAGRAIGIRPRFGETWVEQGKDAEFDVIALDAEGIAISTGGLEFELFREEWRYRWYRRGDHWDYRILIDETTIDSGAVPATTGGAAALSFGLDWGRYRLEIHDPESAAATSVRFAVGWFLSGVAADVPDKLLVTLDRDRYRVGETAKVHIRPPFAGRMLLAVAGARVYETRELEVPAEGLVVELPVKAEWDAGAYVTATLFRAATAGEEHQPARAIGLAWLARDFGERTLGVSIDAPERILPRRTLDVDVAVEGLAGGTAHVTLAAVDEGILQLTGFETPSPAEWYYGKRRLGVALRDAYGYLIRAAEGGPARIRQGGDAAAEGRHLGGLDASSVRTVALFSGIVPVVDGHARIPLEIPDFNGRLRLMAVAWDADQVGSAEAAMVVRDPVVSQVTLPRFLAPGDESRVTVALHNVDGTAGEYRVVFGATGAVSAGGGGTSLTLQADARKDLAFTLTGDEVGSGAVSLIIDGPDGLKLERGWDIAVRPAQTVVTRQIVRQLRSRERQALTADLLEEFVPGTGEVLVTMSTRPQMDLARLLKSLDRYPYGCAEQTTSRALPLLYVGEVAASLGIAEDTLALRAKVQDAVRRILAMQRSDGSFGLWNPTSEREEWLTAYVMDFLTQARELDYPVPDDPWRRGMAWLAGSVGVADYTTANLPARIYALYVLARAGEAKASDLRYVHDVYLRSVPTALARAQLGAALALTGDGRRARSAFAAAGDAWERPRRFWGDWWYWDYGTSLRDMAATVYLSSYSKVEMDDRAAIVQDLAQRAGRSPYLSTQEMAWMLLAARELGESGEVRISVSGRALPASARPVYLSFDDDRLAAGVDLANLGDTALWQGMTVSGVPRDVLAPESNGFSVTRVFYTRDGKRADLGAVRQGDILVALISGEATSGLDHQAMVVDLLPAGFELENARLEGGRDTDELRWLPELAPTRNVELRDDRYVAALTLDGRPRQSFSLAYMVRAVSPGTYRLPAVYVEDMYQPTYFARAGTDTVTVTPVR